MPIGIGVEGGVSRQVGLRNLDRMESERALESLQQLKTHLSLPGGARGVLTLHNRTNDGKEMNLQRRSHFQLDLELESGQRLDDTVTALKTMLEKAGKHEAVVELENYLSSQRVSQWSGETGGHNRIESRKMLEILNNHLREPEEIPRERTGSPPPMEEGAKEDPDLLLKDGEQSEEVSLKEDLRSAPPPVPEKVSPKEDLRPSPPLEEVSPKEDPYTPYKEDLYKPFKIEIGPGLGKGSFGSTYLVKMDGIKGVLKEFTEPQPLSLTRSGGPNEAIGSYLTSRNSPNEYLDKVNIAQPTFYMVSTEKDGNREHRMVTPREMRHLVKEAKKTGSEVLCHGILMPKAEGREVGNLIRGGTLTDVEKRQIVRGTLQSIMALNERGFVHRDIKPENTVFDRESGKTTLIDTGMLFKSSKDQVKNPGSEYGAPVGTPLYMPNRTEGGTEIDLHSLGVMTLALDHPLALEEIREWTRNSSFGPRTLRNKLNDKIQELDKWIPRIQSQKRKEEVVALREALDGLRKDLANPNTLAGFAMKCMEMAEKSPQDWKNREDAQRMYSELLNHFDRNLLPGTDGVN